MNDTATGTGAGDAGPESPPPSPPRRLVRRRDDRMIGGVASGIADYFGVDPAIVRIVFVVLAFAGAAGVLGYVAGWVLLPEAEGPSAPGPAVRSTGPTFWIGVGLLGVAALILADQFAFFGRGLGVPVVLIAVGLALWKVTQDRQTDRQTDRYAAPGSTMAWADPSAPQTGAEEMDEMQTSEMTPGDAGAPTDRPGWTPPPVPSRREQRQASREIGGDWTPPPVPPREPSILGRLTLALMLIVIGGAVALDQAGALTLTFADGAAIALLVIGLGLVVGTWIGRARWLSLIGLVLLPVVLVSSVAQSLDLSLTGGVGDRRFDVTTVSELQDHYDLGAGSLRLDLRDLALPPGTDATTAVRVGAGEVWVTVPDDLTVAVAARVEVGAIDLPGIDDDGTRLSRDVVLGDAGSTPDLTLDLRVGAGQIHVTTVPTTTSDAETGASDGEFTR